ncbi:MAG: hypothetical protein K2G88_10180 [Oscillospiraceae bacterium]|nr:hypothetical protein [Oscillospiraceae bacterium]
MKSYIKFIQNYEVNTKQITMKALTIYQKDYPEYFSKLSEVIGDKGKNCSLAAVINPKRQEVVIFKSRKDGNNWKEVDVYKCIISIFKSKVRRNLYINTDFNSMGITGTLKFPDIPEIKTCKEDNLHDFTLALDKLLSSFRNNPKG